MPDIQTRARPLLSRWSRLASGPTPQHFLLLAFTAAAGALRFTTLDVQSFSSDEAVTALLVRLGFVEMLESIGETESTPPLYYATAWGWARVFGTGEAALRSLSALAGTATIPLAFAAARVLLSPRAAVTAAAIVAFAPMLVGHSQEARSYALLVALTTAGLAVFACVLRRRTPLAVGSWSALGVLAIATHYFAAFVILPQALILLRAGRSRIVLVGQLPLVAAALALLPLAVRQREHGLASNLAAGDPLNARLVITAKQFLVGGASPYDRAAAALVGALAAIAIVRLLTRATPGTRRAAGIAALVGASGVGCVLVLAAAGHDYLIPRNAVAALVPLAIVLSAGAATAARATWLAWTLGTCSVLLAISVSLTTSLSDSRPDWRGFAKSMQDPERSRVLLVAPNLDGWSAVVPLGVYLPGLRPLVEVPERFRPLLGSAASSPPVSMPSVTEIVVAGVQWPLPLSRTAVPPAFRIAGGEDAIAYHWVRYRRMQPRKLDVGALELGSTALLLQESVDGPSSTP